MLTRRISNMLRAGANHWIALLAQWQRVALLWDQFFRMRRLQVRVLRGAFLLSAHFFALQALKGGTPPMASSAQTKRISDPSCSIGSDEGDFS